MEFEEGTVLSGQAPTINNQQFSLHYCEKQSESKRNEGDWITPLGSLQWEWLSPRSFFLSVPSASWQAQTSGMWGCSVLVCAGVWAPGPRPPPPPLCIQLRVGRLAPHHNGVQYSTAHWGIVVSEAPGQKRIHSPAPQQGAAAPSCARCWWLPDGGQREGEEGSICCLRFTLFLLLLHSYVSFGLIAVP